MFYELDAVKDFVSSVKQACTYADNPANITVEFMLNLSEYSEKIDTVNTSKEKLQELFIANCVTPFEGTGVKIETKLYQDSERIYSIGSYRRDLNYNSCLDYDYIVWGESDCMMPEQYFDCIETISAHSRQSNINRHCITFAVRKMWDASWAVLEHTKYRNETFMDSDDPRCGNTPSSIWYYMNQQEMNEVNNQAESYDITLLNYPRFDGSLLTISRDLLLNGVNIPPAVFGTGEDTAMQTMISIVMGEEYKQYVVSNILKVHNRNHPHKRNYILGEDNTANVRSRRSANTIFKNVHKKSYHNLSIVGKSQNRFELL